MNTVKSRMQLQRDLFRGTGMEFAVHSGRLSPGRHGIENLAGHDQMAQRV